MKKEMWKHEKKKCRSMNKEMQKHENEKCRSMKKEMQKHENEKCKRQVNLIGIAKFGNDIKQKSTTDGVYRLFAKRQHDG